MSAVKSESSEVMSASQLQNIKLQLAQITPMLCSIFESSLLHEPNSVTDVDVIDVLDQMANTFKAVLSTLSTIGSKEEWVEIIVKQARNIFKLRAGANKCAESVSRGATRFTYNHLMRLFSAKESVRVDRTNKVRD